MPDQQQPRNKLYEILCAVGVNPIIAVFITHEIKNVSIESMAGILNKYKYSKELSIYIVQRFENLQPIPPLRLEKVKTLCKEIDIEKDHELLQVVLESMGANDLPVSRIDVFLNDEKYKHSEFFIYEKMLYISLQLDQDVDDFIEQIHEEFVRQKSLQKLRTMMNLLSEEEKGNILEQEEINGNIDDLKKADIDSLMEKFRKKINEKLIQQYNSDADIKICADEDLNRILTNLLKEIFALDGGCDCDIIIEFLHDVGFDDGNISQIIRGEIIPQGTIAEVDKDHLEKILLRFESEYDIEGITKLLGQDTDSLLLALKKIFKKEEHILGMVKLLSDIPFSLQKKFLLQEKIIKLFNKEGEECITKLNEESERYKVWEEYYRKFEELEQKERELSPTQMMRMNICQAEDLERESLKDALSYVDEKTKKVEELIEFNNKCFKQLQGMIQNRGLNAEQLKTMFGQVPYLCELYDKLISGVEAENVTDMMDALIDIVEYCSVRDIDEMFKKITESQAAIDLQTSVYEKQDEGHLKEEGKRCRKAERADEPEVDTSGLRRGSSSHWENVISEASLIDQDGRGIENQSSRPDATGVSLGGHDSVADAGRNQSQAAINLQTSVTVGVYDKQDEGYLKEEGTLEVISEIEFKFMLETLSLNEEDKVKIMRLYTARNTPSDITESEMQYLNDKIKEYKKMRSEFLPDIRIYLLGEELEDLFGLSSFSPQVVQKLKDSIVENDDNGIMNCLLEIAELKEISMQELIKEIQEASEQIVKDDRNMDVLMELLHGLKDIELRGSHSETFRVEYSSLARDFLSKMGVEDDAKDSLCGIADGEKLTDEQKTYHEIINKYKIRTNFFREVLGRVGDERELLNCKSIDRLLQLSEEVRAYALSEMGVPYLDNVKIVRILSNVGKSSVARKFILQEEIMYKLFCSNIDFEKYTAVINNSLPKELKARMEMLGNKLCAEMLERSELDMEKLGISLPDEIAIESPLSSEEVENVEKFLSISQAYINDILTRIKTISSGEELTVEGIKSSLKLSDDALDNVIHNFIYAIKSGNTQDVFKYICKISESKGLTIEEIISCMEDPTVVLIESLNKLFYRLNLIQTQVETRHDDDLDDWIFALLRTIGFEEDFIQNLYVFIVTGQQNRAIEIIKGKEIDIAFLDEVMRRAFESQDSPPKYDDSFIRFFLKQSDLALQFMLREMGVETESIKDIIKFHEKNKKNGAKFKFCPQEKLLYKFHQLGINPKDLYKEMESNKNWVKFKKLVNSVDKKELFLILKDLNCDNKQRIYVASLCGISDDNLCDLYLKGRDGYISLDEIDSITSRLTTHVDYVRIRECFDRYFSGCTMDVESIKTFIDVNEQVDGLDEKINAFISKIDSSNESDMVEAFRCILRLINKDIDHVIIQMEEKNYEEMGHKVASLKKILNKLNSIRSYSSVDEVLKHLDGKQVNDIQSAAVEVIKILEKNLKLLTSEPKPEVGIDGITIKQEDIGTLQSYLGYIAQGESQNLQPVGEPKSKESRNFNADCMRIKEIYEKPGSRLGDRSQKSLLVPYMVDLCATEAQMKYLGTEQESKPKQRKRVSQ